MKWFKRRKERNRLKDMVKHCLIVPNINNPNVLASWGYEFRKLKLARLKVQD